MRWNSWLDSVQKCDCFQDFAVANHQPHALSPHDAQAADAHCDDERYICSGRGPAATKPQLDAPQQTLVENRQARPGRGARGSVQVPERSVCQLNATTTARHTADALRKGQLVVYSVVIYSDVSTIHFSCSN